ncbi:MAG: DUF2828 family protein, partial [Lachnospiraceae bacterium]|nr:DUF2828 family protein [Lachnospiraceae bacterium]
AVTYRSTGSECLDLFSTIGALRSAPDEEVVTRFLRAYADDRDLAMKILFFARDIRGGLGERKVFRTILRYLAFTHPESVRKNAELIGEYGRFDDLAVLLGTPCEAEAVRVIRAQLDRDLVAYEAGEEVSLLAKWLPSANASSDETVRRAKRIAKRLGYSEAEYRRILSKLRARIRIIENSLREYDYTFEYEKQPSKALFKYRKAFLRNDGERYQEFLEKAEKESSKLHTGTLAPYDIVAPLVSWDRNTSLSEAEKRSIDVTWKAQEDFTGGENALVVVDGSGSMYCSNNPMPAAVAQSLGIYFAERNKGAFRNHFITFSANPRLVEIKGRDIAEKLQYTMSFNEVSNTNLEKVFELILRTAMKNHIPQEELPSKLYIISDMEFDSACDGADLTNFETAKRRFEAAGYRLPEVVFWNVESRNRQQPVRQNEQGAALVSGCSPQIFDMLKGNILDPQSFMMKVLSSERYLPVLA